jgi:hypothetical protein
MPTYGGGTTHNSGQKINLQMLGTSFGLERYVLIAGMRKDEIGVK